jgi:TRAP-type C4-dicarboxylate transport system permease small subunit
MAAGVVIEHPNRRRAANRATKLLVVVLLLLSAALVAVVTVGGWDVLENAKAVQVVAIALYVLMALLVAFWRRGVLPVAAALAIVMLLFAAVSGVAWFDRDGAAYADAAVDAGTLGLVTLLIVPLQALLIVTALIAFRQAWNVEVERHPDETAAPAAARAG